MNIFLSHMSAHALLSIKLEHLHDALKTLIHQFLLLFVEHVSEGLRHDVLALRELAEQPL